MTNEDAHAALSLITKEMNDLYRNEGIPHKLGHTIAVGEVADALGIEPDDLLLEINKVLRSGKRPRKKPELVECADTVPSIAEEPKLKAREPVPKPVPVPKGRISMTNPFIEENKATVMAKDLRQAKVGEVVEFHCKDFKEAVELRGYLSRAISKAGWKRFQSRIMASILYVHRVK